MTSANALNPSGNCNLYRAGCKTQKQSRQLCLREIITIVMLFINRATPRSQTGVQLITKLLRTMKNPLLLRKGSIIETIIAQLKNISPIEHSCHPSPVTS
jgi:Transposase DDE domain